RSCCRTTLASRVQLALIVSLSHLLYPWLADFKAVNSRLAPLFPCLEECLLKSRDYSSICKDLSKGRAPTPTPMETCNDPPPRLFPGQDTLSHRKSRTGDNLLSRSWRSSPSRPPAAARLPDLVAYVPQSHSLACRPLSCGGAGPSRLRLHR